MAVSDYPPYSSPLSDFSTSENPVEMGRELIDGTVSGMKNPTPPPFQHPLLLGHLSISIPPNSVLSLSKDDTATYVYLLQRRDEERDDGMVALRAEMAQMKQFMDLNVPATSRSTGGRRRCGLRPSQPPLPQTMLEELAYRG